MPRKREEFAASFLLILNTKTKTHVWMWFHIGSANSLAFHSQVDSKCWQNKETRLLGVELGLLLLVICSYSPGQSLNICARGCPTLVVPRWPLPYSPFSFSFLSSTKALHQGSPGKGQGSDTNLACDSGRPLHHSGPQWSPPRRTVLPGGRQHSPSQLSSPLLYSSIISSRLQVHRPPP